MKESDLKTTVNALDLLWNMINASRKTSKTVSVNREHVKNLLIDHAVLVNEVIPHNTMTTRT